MVSIVCSLFVLVGYSIFFVCATLLLKLGDKTPPIYCENWKCSDWCENSVNRLCLVCAGGLCDFFVSATLLLKLGGKTPCIHMVKFQNCPIGAKMFSIVFASFVLEGCVIFSILLVPTPPGEQKPLLYTAKMENSAIGGKMVSIVCTSFVPASCMIFFYFVTPLLHPGSNNPSYI